MFWLVAKYKTFTFKHCLMSCGSWVMMYRALKRNMFIKWHTSQEPQYIKQFWVVFFEKYFLIWLPRTLSFNIHYISNIQNNIKMIWLVAKCKTCTFKHCLMSCGSWVMMSWVLKRNMVIKRHASQEPQYIKQCFKVQVLHFATTQKI